MCYSVSSRRNEFFYAYERDAALVKNVSLVLARVWSELRLQVHASSARSELLEARNDSIKISL